MQDGYIMRKVAHLGVGMVMENTLLIGEQMELILETSKNQAIVFSQTVTIKSSPDNSGNNLFILHEGTKVNIKSRLGEWVEIITSDGNSGWLPANAIEVI